MCTLPFFSPRAPLRHFLPLTKPCVRYGFGRFLLLLSIVCLVR